MNYEEWSHVQMEGKNIKLEILHHTDGEYIKLKYYRELERKLEIVGELIQEEASEDCGCGFEQPVGEGYTDGICRLHQALEQIKGKP